MVRVDRELAQATARMMALLQERLPHAKIEAGPSTIHSADDVSYFTTVRVRDERNGLVYGVSRTLPNVALQHAAFIEDEVERITHMLDAEEAKHQP